ncbi:MAG: alpha-mannosidase [Candidatus Hydrogenedentes bacterium]|nr:alpha-mannosidase [Candidatus Hydrogenedentota bacterium]
MSKRNDITVHMIGHGHIDPTWLWRWTEGYEEVRATFRSALDRMNETPEFRFTASSTCFYAWVKACDPALFEEIRARVAEGRWELAGGWWIEPDCNIPCGESLVRQGLYAQRFFEREFGMRASVGFNPDSFGHAGTFPQLYSKLGIHYYVYMRPMPVHERHYPDGTTFYWVANDGSRVLTCNLQEEYNADANTAERIRTLAAHPQLNPGQRHVLGFFGVGNHGGGPTKRAIQQILDLRKDARGPRAEFSTLRGYFDAFLSHHEVAVIPEIRSDLQHHAQGCYTSHAEIKRLNRHTEHALMSAERWAAAAWLSFGHPYPQEALEHAWKDLLYNQFHDILAGTSIESSYEDSRDQIGGAKHAAHTIENESVQVIARHIDTTPEGNTIAVFNPLPWPVRQTVTAPPAVTRTLDAPIHIVESEGKVVPSQRVLDERVGSHRYAFTADVPAMGYRCYHARSGTKTVKTPGHLKGGRDFLENDWWRIEFDPYDGHLCRLHDRQNDIELLEKGNVLAAVVDPSDTWGHGYAEYRSEAGRFGHARLKLIEHGPVRAAMRVQSSFRNSQADQLVTIYRASDTIDCVFRINWQERYTMLKLAYETHVVNGTAIYDTAYGCQERNTAGTEEPGQMWFDLTGTVEGTPYGLAVLNDCKYGFDVLNGTMRVTLLRSPAYAHHDPSRYDASQPFHIMDQGWHTIRIRLAPHAGAWTAASIARKAWELNEPAVVHLESAHAGSLPGCQSFLEAGPDNIAVSVLKKSEDGDSLVVRGYETAGAGTEAVLRLPLAGIEANCTFAPHEIKTLRIDRQTGMIDEVNLLEEPGEERP